ncbi:DUF924 domain-containing protein [Psychromarinibacter sp. C21-152]|uniref:DUF924 domain-containing protein n=1 Tax=Psychromarinibacter sediminicola TaxID=3033385 RepID=A0AAE3TAA1_9RHOB|nr:DUF924 family protein [Psychromarinibacter sediminicola]MDF0601405.1 DUF924 domain-containing protein [Psychromarinibacter sediminicola]
MANPEDILAYWLDEVGPKGWYGSSEELDADIRNRFAEDWQRAMDGAYALWLTYPSGALAYIILTDQFPRNMFRGEAKAFASDAVALAAAKLSIAHGFDMKIDEPARQFFYMPLMHSECLTDQDRCVRLMKTRMPLTGAGNLKHAKAHREVIRQFGRFPYRNDVLSRATTQPEAAFVGEGGYRKALEQVSA